MPAMPSRFAVPCPGVLWLGLTWLLLLIGVPYETATAEEPPSESAPSSPAQPAAEPSQLAKPATALAGELVRVRPEKDRQDETDLLNKIDLATDVVYSTAESPVPESEQFQFVDGVLRTPEKGDARLCLPLKAPKFYRLSLDTIRKDEAADPPIGIGAVMDGHQFFVEIRMNTVRLSRFYDREIEKPLVAQNAQWHAEEPAGVAELLVGNRAMLVKNRFKFLEWMAAGAALSLDEKWRMPATDKIFITFPKGQFDLRSVRLESLALTQWTRQAIKLVPDGEIASASKAAVAKISAKIEPLPELDALQSTILMRARRGDFDELERWAQRLRTSEAMVDYKLVAELFYGWLANAYVSPLPGGTHGKLEGSFQAQFAFLDAWLKQKPDSVAARIVKGRAYNDYAWDVRGGGFAGEVPPEAWRPFKERLETAEETLNEASQLKPRDVCVFTSLLKVGRPLGWDRKKMERTVERGLQVSKKDYILIDSMVTTLLPRWGGEPGDLGKFAQRMDERIGGDDGLDVYARVARSTQIAEVSLKRQTEDKQAHARSSRDFTDPKVVLEEFSADKLRAAIPIVRERRSKSPRAMNHACWLCCVLDDRATAKELFAEVVDKPDLDVWGSRDEFDHWRRWCDPSVAEPSQYLPVEGEEIAHLQAYSDGATKIRFLLDDRTLITGNPAPASAIKFWDLGQQKVARQFDLPDDLGNLADLWLLERGHLFVTMSDGNKTTIVEYMPPGYARHGHYPANIFGNPFSLISKDGLTTALFTPGAVSIANLRQKTQKDFPVPELTTAELSRDGNYLLGVGDKIRVWDILAGTELFSIDARPKLSCFMRDGSGIIYATDDKLVVSNIADQQQRFSIPLNPQHVVQAACSTPDGRFLVTAERRVAMDDGNERHVVALYDLKRPEPVHVFDGHKNSVLDLAISHDGTLLASSSSDGVVKVWDLGAVMPADKSPKAGQVSGGSQSASRSTTTRTIAIVICLAFLVCGLVVYRNRRRRQS
jgi:hypothetical protein